MQAVIERNADASAAHIQESLEGDADARSTLVRYATGLLRLLTSPVSVALNRAAMGDQNLAEILLRSARHRVGPVVERYLAGLHERGVLQAPDPRHAFGLLYGLAIQDTQTRVLLGEPPPLAAQISERRETAVDQFLRLTAPGPADALRSPDALG